jgi:putative ABC transport system permease protein
MLKNYLKAAIRNIINRKFYSFINISGLTIGIATFILIYLYARLELSYDKFIPDNDRIFRVIASSKSEKGNMIYCSITPNPLASALMQEYPEVEYATRYREHREIQVKFKDEYITEKNIAFADENFFNIFPLDFINGQRESALKEPYTIVLTEEAAKKYFGDENPVGKFLTLSESWFDDYLFKNQDFKITGVIKLPENFHLKFDFLGSFKSVEEKDNYSWEGSVFNTYVKLRKSNNPVDFEEKIKSLILKHVEDTKYVQNTKYFLQPLNDVHFASYIEYDDAQTTDIKDIYLLLSLAALILIIASINYMNLSTARSSTRTKEIGLRKVIGATRKKIIIQFLSESVIVGLIAFIFSILLVELTLPSMSQLVGKKITLLGSNNSYFLLFEIFGIAILTGILSGIYPALYLSSFQPVKVLKGSLASGVLKARLRKLLVVFQFAITIFILICFNVMFNQQSYMKNKDLGFNKENVICLRPDKFLNDSKAYVLKNELLKNIGIVSVTISEGTPLGGWMKTGVLPEGFNKTDKVKSTFYRTDYDFIKTFDMKILSGRDFSQNVASDLSGSCIINQEAVKQFGWGDPIGKKLSGGRMNLTAIGVVKDFHITSLHKKIEPLVICLDSLRWTSNISIKIRPGNPQNTLAFIKEKWSSFYPEKPFDYQFLDEALDSRYKKEEKMSGIFGITSILSVIIASIGLLGLISYSIEQRRKEIGIRKVLGSSIPGITTLLLSEFMKLVLIANIFAIPIAYYYTNIWLQDFAYRIQLSAWIFILSSLLALIIALFTIGFQAVRAARANPVEALKYE